MLDQAQPRRAADSKFTGLDETIEAFEACWSLHGIANILEYLPPLEHPEYTPLTLELICIDLERRWDGGIAKPIDEYCFEHAEFLKDPRMLE